MKPPELLAQARKDIQERERFFMIPFVPPSVNHYKHRTRSGHYYVTRDAKKFKNAVWVYCREKMPPAKAYSIDITVYLGKGQKGDWDNFPKLVCDGLKDAGVIATDAAFKDGAVHLRRDAKAPRTELRLRVSNG